MLKPKPTGKELILLQIKECFVQSKGYKDQKKLMATDWYDPSASGNRLGIDSVLDQTHYEPVLYSNNDIPNNGIECVSDVESRKKMWPTSCINPSFDHSSLQTDFLGKKSSSFSIAA